VKAAGGLVIADEVQSGFGRIGTHMWGHQLFHFTPDLVTMGKPMANGHPVGAVVTTEELLDEFGRRNMYFNTFAGSPVSSAAGMAVLQVMHDEDLMARAEDLGEHIGAHLHRIAEGNPSVRAARGRGLFFGLEFIAPDGDRQAAADLTKALVEEMRERGVLISRIGPHDNVLKMRPPLVFGNEHADLLLDRLDAALDTLAR
jgi:4-aminobutyrate aminotransferase-like enzyme